MLFKQFDPADLNDRVITIDSAINNINLRAMHDQIFPQLTADDVTNGVTVTFVIAANVIVGSNSTSQPACDIGSWISGFVPHIQLLGRIQGCGGQGGGQSPAQAPGKPGGPALYTRNDVTVDADQGEIFGGGGGGGALTGEFTVPGGGGAGKEPGAAGTHSGGGVLNPPAQAGTTEAGGNGGVVSGGGPTLIAGAGGDPGEAGETPPFQFVLFGAPGGGAGPAIDGVSFVTFTSAGDVRGPQIN
jgi:hypothetical protein